MAAVTCVLLTTPSASDRRSMLKRLAAWYSSLRLSAASLISLSGGYTALVCARAHSSHSCGTDAAARHTRGLCASCSTSAARSHLPHLPAWCLPRTLIRPPAPCLARRVRRMSFSFGVLSRVLHLCPRPGAVRIYLDLSRICFRSFRVRRCYTVRVRLGYTW